MPPALLLLARQPLLGLELELLAGEGPLIVLLVVVLGCSTIAFGDGFPLGGSVAILEAPMLLARCTNRSIPTEFSDLHRVREYLPPQGSR